MKGATVAGLLMVAILAGAGVGYLLGNANERTVTSVTSSVSTSTETMTVTSTTLETTTATTTETSTLSPPSFVFNNALVYESAGAFQWLDPSVSYYQNDFGILQNTFEKLLWFSGDNSSQLIPWLASDMGTMSNSGHTWTFHLREGVRFADGTPFNSTAVWFSITRLLMLDGTAGDKSVHGSQSAWIIQQLLNKSLSSYYEGSSSQSYDARWVQDVLNENFVQIIDPYTIQFNIMHPSASFPYLISNEWADIMSPSWVVGHDAPSLLKSHMTTADYLPYWQQFAGLSNNLTAMLQPSTTVPVLAGTGPYYVTSANSTTYDVVLKANPNYWGGPSGFKVNGQEIAIGRPRIQTIYWNYVPDPNRALLDMKAGRATMVDGPLDGFSSLLYSYIDQNTWLAQGKMVSIIPGVTDYGNYQTLVTEWFGFGSNITNPDGSLRTFQPFADWRLRMAVQVSVNMTSLVSNLTNRLDVPANTLVPPGTNPAGSYSSGVAAPQYNLTYAEQLLKEAAASPLKSSCGCLHFFNGTVIPPGVVDNSVSPTNQENIMLIYVPGGVDRGITNTIAANLNKISTSDGLGFNFVSAPLPSRVTSSPPDFFHAGWVADYNWVTDWLGPMYLSTGIWFSWAHWNNTALDRLTNAALAADSTGNLTGLVALANQASALENQDGYYMWEDNPSVYFPVSSWLHGFYYNVAIGDPGLYFPTYSYAAA